MKILDLSDSNILRMVLFNRISWFSPTESIKNWFSPTQLSPEWFCYEYSADWICRAESFCRLILSSRILQTDSVKQNHSADWFCQAESFCSYSPQKNSNPKSWDLYIRCSIYRSQLFGLPFIWGEWKQNDSARQNHSAELTQQNHSAAQNHSAKSKQDDSVLQNESLLILLEWEEEEFQKEMWTIALEKYS